MPSDDMSKNVFIYTIIIYIISAISTLTPFLFRF